MAFASYRSTIESIYRAVREPNNWPSALAGAADYTGGTGALIARHDLSANRGTLVSARLREDLSGLYLRSYGRNPFSVGILRFPPGSVQIGRRLADPAALRKTAFHADILAPQGIADKLMVGHSPFMSQTQTGGFAIMLDARGADDAERRRARFGRLAPHLSAALELSHLVGELPARRRQLSAVLEAMPLPSMIVDAQGRIQALNAAAEAMLSRAERLLVEPGLIVTSALRSERAILAGVIAAAAGPDAMPSLQRLTSASGSMLLVKGTPLPASVAEDWDGRAGGMCVLLQVAAPDAESTPSHDRAWRDLFGLTPAEARIATLFGRGLTAAEAAEIAGVSVNTARTHIAHCFGKTGVHSQAALARLLVAVEQLDR